MNYQKELDKLLARLSEEEKTPVFCFTAAARPAAVTCWNISASIFVSRFFITIPIFFLKVNIPRGYWNSRR